LTSRPFDNPQTLDSKRESISGALKTPRVPKSAALVRNNVFLTRLFLTAVLPPWLLALSGVAHAGRIFSPDLDLIEMCWTGNTATSYSRVQSASISPHPRNLFVTSSDRYSAIDTLLCALHCMGFQSYHQSHNGVIPFLVAVTEEKIEHFWHIRR